MSKYSVLSEATIAADYLTTNATTHKDPFSAMAELLDNSRDAQAKSVNIYTTDVDTRISTEGFMLSFLDDGHGMSPSEIKFGQKRDFSFSIKIF
jgi:DNA mismatch repair ATPase MutL